MVAGVFLLAVHILVAQPPPHEDCLPYNPQTLKIEPQGSGMWLLTDGYSRMEVFLTKEDAQNGLALALRYSEHCFIGRHTSTRPNMTVRERSRYIVHYWKGPTGKQTSISPETCQPYDDSALHAEDKGAAGWIVTDRKRLQIPVDNAADADRLIVLARQYRSYCIIGGASPPFPLSRVDYWQ